MTIEAAIKHVGGITLLAKALGVTPQHVVNWRARGVPAERCPSIERMTAGAVRCEELRPDIDWGVLREGRNNADV
jgi:DNA-binding transcriptional regulator YdaS (Cro superfamily)